MNLHCTCILVHAQATQPPQQPPHHPQPHKQTTHQLTEQKRPTYHEILIFYAEACDLSSYLEGGGGGGGGDGAWGGRGGGDGAWGGRGGWVEGAKADK